MTNLPEALSLARQGFHMFPLRQGSKLPAIEKFPTRATTDAAKIERWAAKYPGCNWGISTSAYGAGEALLVVDVDGAGHGDGTKNGPASLVRLELEGNDFPLTREHATPTGGRHLLYRVSSAVRQGADVLGSGLDVRSKGGYVVSPGSVVAAGEYFVDRPARPEPAPQWLIETCGTPRERTSNRAPLPGINADRARIRASEYLRTEAPEAIDGAGGDQTTFIVAAKLKDLGVSPEVAADLMAEEWFDGCGWTAEELATKVRNAFNYGQNPQGADAPEAQFQPIADADGAPKGIHPFDALNREYALALNDGEATVYREQVTAGGQKKFTPMKKGSFDLVLKDRKVDGKPLAELWLGSPRRRFYRNGVDFVPERDAGDGVLNLWGGFAVQARAGNWSRFRALIRDVICGGDAAADAYVIGWLAHMVQRPYEPAGVALVLRGGQGTGKSTFGEIVGSMFGEHFVHIYSRDQLTGHFNRHLACKVMILADEAFFAGNRQDAPVLKALLTQGTMLMEAKGVDVVRVRNCAHVVMASNDEWVVPASEDQRRFCVLDVVDRHRNDRVYFGQIRKQMETGGVEAMLHDLLHYDLTAFNIGHFPETAAGTDQKVASLEGPARWMHDALYARTVAHEAWGSAPVQVDKELLYADYSLRSRVEFKEYRPAQRPQFWAKLRAILGEAIRDVRLRTDDSRTRVCVLPALEEARAAFERFLGGRALEWEAS
jgi:hypothetical protein